MQRIHERWGGLITEACKYSSIPQEFLAALIANESGGDPQAKRFEPGVYKHLSAVREGRESRYGNLTRAELLPLDDSGLRNLASSWGLTQVMGYHVARRPGGIEILLDPKTHLNFALGMLAEFAERFSLHATLEFEELFHCWNTGSPYKETYDPRYCERGLARMKIYAEIGNRKLETGDQTSGEKG